MTTETKHTDYWLNVEPSQVEAHLGSVSSCTMRLQDVLPAVWAQIEHRFPEEAAGIARADRNIFRVLRWCPSALDYMSEEEVKRCPRVSKACEEASYFLNEELWDMMNRNLPEGVGFGSHPGDGADYGYWLDEEYTFIYERIVRDDQVIVLYFEGDQLSCERLVDVAQDRGLLRANSEITWNEATRDCTAQITIEARDFSWLDHEMVTINRERDKDRFIWIVDMKVLGEDDDEPV